MKLLIIENEPLIAADLKAICEHHGYDVVGICFSSSQALDMLESRKPDLVLLDIHLGVGLSGIDIANIINAKYQIPFIYITSFVDDVTLGAVNETLPLGYIVKPFEDQDIVTTIKVGMFRYQHNTQIEKSGLDSLNERVDKKISEREFEIIQMILSSKSNAEIAKSLFISENTIKTHVKRIYQKLGVHSRVELVKFVIA